MPQKLIERDPQIVLTLQGDSGHGKTTLAATLARHAEFQDVLFLDTDRRLSSVVGMYSDHILVDDINSTEDIQKSIYGVINRYKEKYAQYRNVRTVVVDSLSAWNQLEKQHLGYRGLTKTDKDPRHSQDIIYLQDYGEATNRISRLIRNLIGSGVHVIITAHIRNFYSDDKQTILKRRRVHAQESLGIEIQRMSSFQWAVKRSENIIELMVDTDGKTDAKTSGTKFVKALRDNNILIEKEKGSGKKVRKVKVIEIEGSIDNEEGLVLTPDLADLFDLYLEVQYGR